MPRADGTLKRSELREIEAMLTPDDSPGRHHWEPWTARLDPGDSERVQIISFPDRQIIDQMPLADFHALADDERLWG